MIHEASERSYNDCDRKERVHRFCLQRQESLCRILNKSLDLWKIRKNYTVIHTEHTNTNNISEMVDFSSIHHH